jgi:hypothetical protein
VARAPAIDRVVARYQLTVVPVKREGFVTERVLAYEARVFAMVVDGAAPLQPLEERHVRSALEQHVAEEVLCAMGTGDVDGRSVDEAEALLREATSDRVAAEALEQARLREGLTLFETHALSRRHACAAAVIDRIVAPVLAPGEEQIALVYRRSAHPYRGLPLTEVRERLTRWYVEERLRVLLSAYFQNVRGRLAMRVASTPPSP